MGARPLSRRANATVLIVIIGSLAAAPMMLPSDAELGSHLFSDNEQVEARRYLEAALRVRGREEQVVVPLAKIYGEQERHEEALSLLRDLKKTTPGLGVMRRNLLRRSGRLLTYVEDLERQRAPEPGPRELEELSRLYGGQDLVELRLEVIQRLWRTSPNDLKLTRQLVYLLLRQGQRFDALRTMRSLWHGSPTRVTRADFLLLARLAIELEPAEQAFQLVHTHIDRLGLPTDRVAMARLMMGVGRFQQAVALLERAMRQPRASADTIEVWALAQVALGHTGAAYAELRSRADSASARTTRLLCDLALRQGDDLGALRIGGQADFLGLDATILLSLARAAMRVNSRARLKRILARLDAESLEKDRVTTAHMFWAVRDKKAALRWAEKAAKQPDLPHAQRLWLAELYLRANRSREVAQLMQGAAETGSTGVSPLRVALMWWRARAPRRGLAGWPRVSRDKRIRAGRALLLAGSGRPDQAFELVRGHTRIAAQLVKLERGRKTQGSGHSRVRDWLSALATEANGANHRPLATWVYGQLLSLGPSDRRMRLALAQSQLVDKAPGKAWTTIRRLRPPLSTEEAGARRAILLAAHGAKEPVKDELITEAVDYIATLSLKGREAQSWLHVLLKLGANREALPFVERLASAGDRAWQSRRIELWTALGDKAAIQAWWRTQGADRRQSKQTRLHAATQLLSVKDRDGAVEVYKSIAARERADGVAVGQLVRLWGPRPPAAAVRWLSERTQQSNGREKAAWLRHLLWMNATDDVERLLGKNPPEGALLDIAVDTLVAQRRYVALGALTLRRLPKLRKAKTILRLAQLCDAHDQKIVARAGYTRLVALNPTDGAAIRFLAQSYRGETAIRWWQKLFALRRANRPQEVWQDRAALGELLLAKQQQNDGYQQLRVALRLAGSLPTGRREEVRGRLLARLGRHLEAATALTRAVGQRPCDDRLRADLVSSLMAAQQLERARKLVDRPAHCRKDSGR